MAQRQRADKAYLRCTWPVRCVRCLNIMQFLRYFASIPRDVVVVACEIYQVKRQQQQQQQRGSTSDLLSLEFASSLLLL